MVEYKNKKQNCIFLVFNKQIKLLLHISGVNENESFMQHYWQTTDVIIQL